MSVPSTSKRTALIVLRSGNGLFSGLALIVMPAISMVSAGAALPVILTASIQRNAPAYTMHCDVQNMNDVKTRGSEPSIRNIDSSLFWHRRRASPYSSGTAVLVAAALTLSDGRWAAAVGARLSEASCSLIPGGRTARFRFLHDARLAIYAIPLSLCACAVSKNWASLTG